MTEIEDRWTDLGEFIREQRRVGQLSLRKLSEMAGISNPYLSQIERGLRKPSAEILRQIAGALHISAETLYIRAGILDERDGEHDLVADIRRDPFLDEAQKKNLVQIYLSFRAAHLADLEARGLPAPGAPSPGSVALPPESDDDHDRDRSPAAGGRPAHAGIDDVDRPDRTAGLPSAVSELPLDGHLVGAGDPSPGGTATNGDAPHRHGDADLDPDADPGGDPGGAPPA